MQQRSDEQRPPARDRPEQGERRAPERLTDRDDDAMTDEDARAPDTAVTEEPEEEP
ncbi:hypothetical protein [Micromonospora sp. WMMD812]|uniref:hypothetical protein n=1 Tax=Micromonospora sp. WMMD812 TaxID=3015152 RepID=UPI00248C72B4|nr:hypothetical protein [Micromonospora sp. WMMD812]WBB69936.1 hypothetical protein O7603_11505 [Micromonospora sp. WMMD812]